MAEYTDLLPEAIDPTSIEEETYEQIQARWPEWEPADGNLEVWIIKALAFRISELNETAVDVADEIFATYGQMRNIPRFDPAPAVGETTWTMVDDQGYTIPAGIEVVVPRSGNDLIMFEVTEEVVIPPGQTTGTINLVAQEPGTSGNNLTADPQLIDALAYVERIELTSPSTGGVDEEDLGAYLTRLTERLQVATETPIVPRDFEVIARTFLPFVSRAVARDGWDPGTETDDNERMISLAVMDPAGEPLTSPQKAEVKDLLESMREVNFIVHVIDADYTAIDVSLDFEPMPGFDSGAVRASVDDALAVYLSPAEWGRSQVTGAGPEFVIQDTVRYLELASLIDRVPGVDYINDLKLAKAGDPLATNNITLTGAVPLTRPGTFS